MKLRWIASVLVFISAYSPLSVIFLIQDYDFSTNKLQHPGIIWTFVAVSAISCLVVWLAVSRIKVTTPPVKVLSVSNRSGELVNYAIPYMISFFAMDLNDINVLVSFLFFMFVMYWLTLKTHNIFINPILAVLGYNLYDVKYSKNGKEYESFFLSKAPRLTIDEKCRIAEVSDQLFLVTERDPEV